MSTFIRKFHRMLAVAFTLGFIVNFFAWRGGQAPAGWVTALAVLPLILLLFSGLYLFVLPYVRRAKPMETSTP